MIILYENEQETTVGNMPMQFSGRECPINVEVLSRSDKEWLEHHWNPCGEFDVDDDVYAKVLLAGK